MSYLPNIEQQQPEEPFPVDDGGNANVNLASQETMDSRTAKFKYGLGDLLQKTRDEIYQDIQNGNEAELRGTAASSIDERKQQATTSLLAQVAANKQGDLTPDERSGLIRMVQSLTKTTDPNTVMEQSYAKQFLAQLDRTAAGSPDNNVLRDAQIAAPEQMAKITNDHTDLITKNQILETMIEDQKDKLKNQGWAGWALDTTKGFIPGYEDYNLRGLTPDVSAFSKYGLGANLEEVRKNLMRLEPSDLRDKLTGIGADLESGILGGNPQLFLTFLEAMKGMTTQEQFVRNWQGPVDVAGTVIGSKTASTAVKSALRIGEKAVQDMSIASNTAGATKSSIEAASGDLTESAITRVTADTVADAHGVPNATQRGIEALTSTQRADEAPIRQFPGRYGQDLANRIIERGNSVFSDLMDAAQNIQKNERLPEVLSNETVVRAIVEDMKGKYRDLKNSIIDTSGIYREPLANTYLIDFHLGTNNGAYFKSEEVAKNWAKFHGLGDAEIIEGKSPLYTEASARLRKLDSQIAEIEATMEKRSTEMTDETLSAEKRAKAQSQFEGLGQLREVKAAERGDHLEQQSLNLQKVSVEQQGLGFYVRVTKPVDETRPAIRDALALTRNTKAPDGPVAQFMNSWLGKYRTPDNVLSSAENANRKTSTYAPSWYFKVMVDNAKEIQGLQRGRFSTDRAGRKRWTEWQRGLENAQELPDPLDPERKGYFFQSPREMENFWQQWFHRLPDEQEIGAYFEFKRGMEMDRVLRNMSEQRNMQRLGNEMHSIIVKDPSGKEIKSEAFVGKRHDKIPGSSDNVAVFTTDLGKERVKSFKKMSVKDKEELQADIDRGYYKLIEIYNPTNRPLKGFSGITDERVRFVAAPQIETKGLDWNHVPRRGGGHVQYDYDYYLKQAKVRVDSVGGGHDYEGDTTIMAVPLRGIGNETAKHLNQVRSMLKSRIAEDQVRDYANKHLHVDWDELKSWFVGSVDSNGKYQPPRLSINEEIKVVPKNKKIIDLDNDMRFRYTDFRDATKEGSMAAQNVNEFTQERDAFEMQAVTAEGTKANPLYKVAPADKVDPITTMNRGLVNIARSQFMDDYKTMAVEHWLAQARNYLEAKTPKEIYQSPYYFFAQGKFLKSTPPEIKRQLEAARWHINQFVGQPSDTDALLVSASQKLADISFKNFGPKGLIIEPTWALPFLRDPLKYGRAMAFHMKLGLFNIPQFIVQAGNYANIMGIAGHKYATPGTLAAQLHFWSTVNSHPSIINHLDGIASRMYVPGASSWKPGEFKEAMREMQLSGFGSVGGEYGALDDLMHTKVITKGPQTFLDWGLMFFKGGEQNARYGAWYTAFKEFRDANPVGRLTNADRQKILARADLLNINMSRASASRLHTGVMSIPTQFYTYQLRLTELMFSGRLTNLERTRLFATNAALFGIPMAAGMTSLPVADYIREKFLENGYVVGENYLQSMLMEGIPSALGALATGKGDPQKGQWYDVGPRFGTKGLEFLGRATGGVDKGWFDLLGGPVYSIAKNTWQMSDGLMYAMGSMAHGDGQAFPMVAEDVTDVFREISSINSAYRVYAATQFGRWVSRKDAYLADATAGQAVFGAVTGLKETQIDDIQLMLNSIKKQSEYERQVEDQFRQEFRRGMLAQNDNPELAKRFFTRAQAWLAISGYREDRINSVISKALSENESILDKTKWDFYIRKAPDAQAPARYGAFRKTQRLDDLRRGE